MPPNDLVTELQTGERDLAIDGPDPKDFNDYAPLSMPRIQKDMEAEQYDTPHIQVAPGIYQSKEDYDANMAYDEMRDMELQDSL